MQNFLTEHDEHNEALMIYELARPLGVAFERRLDDLDLTRGQWHLLSVLRRYPGISQARAAVILQVEPISLSRQLDRMEKQGWVVRKPNPDDRRANQVFLTDQVDGVVEVILARCKVFRAELLEGFSPQEHAVLVAMLERMSKNLGAMLMQPAPDNADKQAGSDSRRLVARERNEQIFELNLIG